MKLLVFGYKLSGNKQGYVLRELLSRLYKNSGTLIIFRL